MSFPLNYRETMTIAANIAQDKTEPGYVRAKLLCTLIRELSPLNEHHAEVKRELGIEETPVAVRIDEEAESRAYMAGVQAGLARAAEAAEIEAEAEVRVEEEEDVEEREDPL